MTHDLRASKFVFCTIALVLAAGGVAAAAQGLSAQDMSTAATGHGKAAHVLLPSIDGLHEFDLANYIAAHPASALAGLVGRGTRYTNVTSSRPSDSFPGTLAMTTGGSSPRPASTTTLRGTTSCRLLAIRSAWRAAPSRPSMARPTSMTAWSMRCSIRPNFRAIRSAAARRCTRTTFCA